MSNWCLPLSMSPDDSPISSDDPCRYQENKDAKDRVKQVMIAFITFLNFLKDSINLTHDFKECVS